MNMRTKIRFLLVIIANILSPSTLLAQHSSDEVIAFYRQETTGHSMDFGLRYLCQLHGAVSREALDDLTARMVDLAITSQDSRIANDVAFDLSTAGSPPDDFDCVPYEGSWDAMTKLYRETDILIEALLEYDVKRGIDYGLTLLPNMDPEDDRNKICSLVGHIVHAGELSLQSNGALLFIMRASDGYDIYSMVPSYSSAPVVALAEELMFEGFIQPTGWPWSPCIGPGTKGIVHTHDEDGNMMPPDTGWADMKDKSGFYLSPTGDTIRVLKRIQRDR